MSAAPATTDFLSVRRQRIGLVLGCWLLAGCLIVGQLLIVRQIYAQAELIGRFSDHIVVPSDDWRWWGALLPMLLMVAALSMQLSWLDGIWQSMSAFAAAIFAPVFLLCLVAAEARGPGTITSLRLSDGHRFIMAYEAFGWDEVYALYEDADVTGLTWRRLSYLAYPEDGKFFGHAHLVATADERWLLVTRGGIWTDCFRLVGDRPVYVEVRPDPSSNSVDYETSMRRRSERIAALTGMHR